MAQKVEVTITDDLDGKPGAETVAFGFEGKNYEIDLSSKNQRIMTEAFRTYIDAARAVSNGGRRRGTRRDPSARNRSHAIRAWARQQGITVSERGRIPVSVMNDYDAAH